MESLNDIVKFSNKMHTCRNNAKIIEDFDLNLPNKYDLEREDYLNILKALGQLDCEVTDANRYREFNVLFQTKLQDKLQILNIFHDGSIIPENSLTWLNKSLEDIANGKLEWTQYRHGNLIAGQLIKDVNGRIYLENLKDSKYTVKTTLEIPV